MLRKRSIEPEESTECAQRGQASCGQKLSPCGCRLPFSILKTVLQNAEQRGGFTLAELMIVIGAIGILSGIVVTAINPRDRIIAANDVKRAGVLAEYQKIAAMAEIDPQYVEEFAEFAAAVSDLQQLQNPPG